VEILSPLKNPFQMTVNQVTWNSIRYLALGCFLFIGIAGFSQLLTPQEDWLLAPGRYVTSINSSEGKMVIGNGLVRRSFVTTPNLACIDFTNLTSGQQLLRAVQPEARLTIDGTTYRVGGLLGQQEQAYLKSEWVAGMRSDPTDFQYEGYEVTELKSPVQWKSNTWKGQGRVVEGKEIQFHFRNGTANLQSLKVTVHYGIYDGIPLLVKWLTLENTGSKSFQIERVVNEVLAIVEEESAVVGSPDEMKKQHGLYVETNYAFNNAMRYDISDQTTHWKTDSSYTSQVNYNFQTPCLLEVYPEKATGTMLGPGEQYTSVRTHELLMDSYDRERRGLAIRKMYRTVAPWTQQNPIFMHLVSRTDAEVTTAIDQCVATGYEAVILSFGSHCQMEDTTSANLKRWKRLADYAHQRGILIGGYALFSSRRISDEDDVISPVTGKPGGAFFGNAPCFGSRWGLGFRDKIKKFIAATGFDIWENDGPYPGDVCASTTHPGHRGLSDSQWQQMEIQKGLYRWLNERGVYINAPDWYFLDGTHKIAIGYREVNFSLSREQQKILNRQNIFDGTWEKTPSMGWGFVPLTRYQGGGPEAILEPLKDHLPDYRQLMMQYYGAGVQACYRGPRLYDSEETRKTVSSVIEWYKQHREILNADIIHLRRPDGRDWDGILHVDPAGKEKALMMLFNPTRQTLTRTIQVPLYYAGLQGRARVVSQNGKEEGVDLNPAGTATYTFTLGPDSYGWYLIQQPE